MRKRDVKVGLTLVNRYGQEFHIKGIVKRGAVGTLGSDVHQVLREWSELREGWQGWKPKATNKPFVD